VPATRATTSADAGPADALRRLARYERHVQMPLDVLALSSLWLVVIPPWDLGAATVPALVARAGISLVYIVDITVRALLAGRYWSYVRAHPLGVLAALVPPLRVVLSVRLVRSVFQRGHLDRFLVAAALLVVNGALVIYFFERHAPGGNVRNVGDALWWSMVTVTSVGYGDRYPVTVPGRITAVFVMVVGLLTLAVVTAQVASAFLEQGRAADRSGTARRTPSVPTAAELDARVARLEGLVGRPGPSTSAPDDDLPAREPPG
jgi:voltage-gated potassium channel